jgi:translation elongation factor EF-1beta
MMKITNNKFFFNFSFVAQLKMSLIDVNTPKILEDDAANDAKIEKTASEYEAKKSAAGSIAPKSTVVFDIKPRDEKTDLVQLEKLVRAIKLDGLLWGESKQESLVYDIKKLEISCVVVDDKVSVDLLQEKICALKDFVQSVDIVAFNKI